jgi:hypothetical protein
MNPQAGNVGPAASDAPPVRRIKWRLMRRLLFGAEMPTPIPARPIGWGNTHVTVFHECTGRRQSLSSCRE